MGVSRLRGAKNDENLSDGDGGKVLEISVASDSTASRGAIWAKERRGAEDRPALQPTVRQLWLKLAQISDPTTSPGRSRWPSAIRCSATASSASRELHDQMVLARRLDQPDVSRTQVAKLL
jgi:hypothetical protein